MQDYEVALARAYLAAAGNDPVAALIRSVKDLALAYREGAGAPARPSATSRLVASRQRSA